VPVRAGAAERGAGGPVWAPGRRAVPAGRVRAASLGFPRRGSWARRGDGPLLLRGAARRLRAGGRGGGRSVSPGPGGGGRGGERLIGDGAGALPRSVA